MKVKIIHSDPEALDRINRYAKQLLRRTLESYLPSIYSVTVKVSHGIGMQLGECDYHCLFKICMRQGSDIRIEVRDCDEILSIYRAIEKATNMIEHQVSCLSNEDSKL